MSTFVSELEKKKKGAMLVIQKVPHVLPHREVINSEWKVLRGIRVYFYRKFRILNCFRIGFSSSEISIISIPKFSITVTYASCEQAFHLGHQSCGVTRGSLRSTLSPSPLPAPFDSLHFLPSSGVSTWRFREQKHSRARRKRLHRIG